MVNMIAHHGHIHVPPPLHSLDSLARANLGGALNRQSFLCSRFETPNNAVSGLHGSTKAHGFSALITGIAIVHTTGVPVVYSFELAPSTCKCAFRIEDEKNVLKMHQS